MDLDFGSYGVGSKALYFFSNNLNPNRDTLIFIHGFPDGPDIWNDLTCFFKERYNLVIPFLPGIHPKCESNKNMMNSFLLQVIKFVNDLKLNRKVHLIGHDVGGVLIDKLSFLLGGDCSSLTFINTMGLGLYTDNLRYRQALKSWYVPIFYTPVGKLLISKTRSFSEKLIKSIDASSNIDSFPQKLNSIGLYREFLNDLSTSIKNQRVNDSRSLFLLSTNDPFVRIPCQTKIRKFYPNSTVRAVKGGHWEFYHRAEYFSQLINNHILNTVESLKEEVL